MFYETVFETGDSSVAEYADDTAALGAVKAQHDRAKVGERNGPQGGPASRVSAVFVYPSHPGSLNEDGGLSSDVLESGLKDLVSNMKDKNGVVNVLAFAEAVQGLVHPMVTPDTPHGSRFKMVAVRELDLSALDGAEA